MGKIKKYILASILAACLIAVSVYFLVSFVKSLPPEQKKFHQTVQVLLNSKQYDQAVKYLEEVQNKIVKHPNAIYFAQVAFYQTQIAFLKYKEMGSDPNDQDSFEQLQKIKATYYDQLNNIEEYKKTNAISESDFINLKQPLNLALSELASYENERFGSLVSRLLNQLQSQSMQNLQIEPSKAQKKK